MLILSRKAEQRIRVGDDIEIAVLAVEGDHVKLGITAPRHIPILRTELLKEVEAENVAAALAAARPATELAGSLLRALGPGLLGRRP